MTNLKQAVGAHLPPQAGAQHEQAAAGDGVQPVRVARRQGQGAGEARALEEGGVLRRAVLVRVLVAGAVLPLRDGEARLSSRTGGTSVDLSAYTVRYMYCVLAFVYTSWLLLSPRAARAVLSGFWELYMQADIVRVVTLVTASTSKWGRGSGKEQYVDEASQHVHEHESGGVYANSDGIRICYKDRSPICHPLPLGDLFHSDVVLLVRARRPQLDLLHAQLLRLCSRRRCGRRHGHCGGHGRGGPRTTARRAHGSLARASHVQLKRTRTWMCWLASRPRCCRRVNRASLPDRVRRTRPASRRL